MRRLILFFVIVKIFITPLFTAEKKEEVKKNQVLVFIVNEKSPVFAIMKKEKKEAMEKKSIKDIYLGKTKFWEKIRIYPVNQKDSEIFEKFLDDFIGLTVSGYKSFWVKKVFSEGGEGSKVLENAEEIVKFVSQKQGAIGYVYSDNLTGEEEGISILKVSNEKKEK